MIIVRAELHNERGKLADLGMLKIDDQGDGRFVGHFQGGATKLLPIRAAIVENWPQQGRHAWGLIRTMLQKIGV